MKIFEEIQAPVQGKLVPFSNYKPFIDLPDTMADENIKAVLIKNGEERLQSEYAILKATDYLRFCRDGDRSVYEKAYFDRRSMVFDLVLAEYCERKGRFSDKLAEGVWHILEESTWVVPAHMKTAGGGISALTPEFGENVTLIDLFSACTGSTLAWVYHLGKDTLDGVSPIINDRILFELDRRLFQPFMNDNKNNWWTGFAGRKVNNWNPWIVSNVLNAAALCIHDDTFREKLVERSMLMLDNFTKEYHPDGGCDEGPGYWTAAGAAYFDALEILYDMTGGKINVFDVPLVRKMGEYIVNAHICGDYFLTFADAHARLSLDYAMVSRFGRRTHSTRLENFGGEGYKKNGLLRAGISHPYRSVKDLFDCPQKTGGYTCAESVWLGGIDVMVQRQCNRQDEGLYLAIKGGSNAESHNHNDTGNFIIYAEGEPLLVDAGVGTYRKETFSEDTRYSIWTMQSSYHNLPEINGVMQKEGSKYRAENTVFDEKARTLTMNLENAYPEESGLKKYIRKAEFTEDSAVITDEFQLETLGDIVFNLLLCDEPKLTVTGTALLARGHSLAYDKSLSASVEIIELTDTKLREDWQRDRLFRLRLTAEKIKAGTFSITIK